MPPVKKALIVWGGWPGHKPEESASLFRDILSAEGFDTVVSGELDALRETAEFDLLVPVYTTGTINEDQLKGAVDAVRGGVGVAGAHGGMCDAFREATEWQFMTGGQFVAHPGDAGARYRVEIVDREHPATKGIDDFDVNSEQYYMHMDPASQVLAISRFPSLNGNPPVEMPAVWVKSYGAGRVFYCSVGHRPEDLASEPARSLMRQGFLWAAR
jgi:type 1 glutamine amidotransferase